MEEGGDPVLVGEVQDGNMGILVWMDEREGLTRFCGWQGPGITWKMGRGPIGVGSSQNCGRREDPEGSVGTPGAAAATCAPLPTWALGGPAWGRCHGGRAPLGLAGGGRRGLVARVTRASGIGRRGGVAMVTGRGGAGARPGSGVMAAVAGEALLMLLMAAALALAGGDDSDWVRLPSKCEGKHSGTGVIGRRPLSAGAGGCRCGAAPPRAAPVPASCPRAPLLPAVT